MKSTVHSHKLFVACVVLLAMFATVSFAADVPRWAVAVLASGAEFALEVPSDAAARSRGYMFREHVGPTEGMLFVFDSVGHHAMWMKNCKIPLDIIWLDREFRVVQIAHTLPPCPPDGECRPEQPMRASAYVLELAAGRASEEGLAVGHRIHVISEPPLPSMP